MASIVLSNIGSALGNQLVPGIGGRILGSIGSKFGREFDQEIGWTSASSPKDGPRLESMNVQDSRYGVSIPVVFGQVRVAGNIIWISDLIETSHQSETGGGKGGSMGIGASSSRTTYSYSVHCAIAVAAGEIGGIGTIWADSKVIYQNGVWKSGVVNDATFYNGDKYQEVDPLLQSFIGEGQVPAYRGLAYVVLESLQLGNFGNRLPNLTFEVLPKKNDINPDWLGYVDAAVCNRSVVVRNGGMLPIIIDSGAAKARRVIVGGYETLDGTAQFEVVEYDVSGDAPEELFRVKGDAFECADICDHSWSLSPDKRFVVLYLQDSDTVPTYNFVIYDAENNSFGQVYSIDLIFSGGTKQVAWIDAQHFVIADCYLQRRGVRVFARAGLNIVDLGFFNVWGDGSLNSLKHLFYAQFTPAFGGLLHYIADNSPSFTSVYVRSLVWQDNNLVVGGAYTLTSGYSTGYGSGGQANLVPTGEDEWTLFYSTTVDLQVMSFVPGLSSAVITRPWQRFESSLFSVSLCNFPIVFGNRIVVVQRSSEDNYYRFSEISLESGEFSLFIDGAIVGSFSMPVSNFNGIKIDGSRLLLSALGAYYNVSQLAIIERFNTGDTLEKVVSGIASRAGYSGYSFDASELAGVVVDGYVINGQMDAASALAPLRVYEPFDVIESGTQLKVVKHGNNLAAEILESDYCSVDKCVSGFILSRAQELDLPLEVTVDYLDASRDYEVGSQRAKRSATRGARVMAKLHLPIVCTALKAKQLAEARLYKAWAERDEIALQLSKKWLSLELGDVVEVGDKRIRITYIRYDGGLVGIRGISVPFSSANGASSADAGNIAGGVDIKIVNSVLYLMDLPLLRNADDQPGIYVAIGGSDGWSGASLWRAADGVNFNNLASFNASTISGIATSVLPAAEACYMDKVGHVDVQLMRGSLASCSYENLLNEANVALLGGEIIQFQNAVLIGAGLYRLENILRGRRGTENYIGSHVVGESFVLLNEDTVRFIPAQLNDRGRNYSFRALSNGQSLGAVVDVGATYGIVTLRPLAPVHLTGYRSGGAGSDLVINWKRRVRKNGEWIDNVDVPLDEPLELYDVEIMDGAVVKRSFCGLSVATVTYSYAQQQSDWGGTIPAQFSVNVYQVGARYGRGVGASGVV